jgi:hypothetical protein
MNSYSNPRSFFQWVIPILSFICGIVLTAFFMLGIQVSSTVSDSNPAKPLSEPEVVEIDQPDHPAEEDPSALPQPFALAPVNGALEAQPIPKEWEDSLCAALELQDMGQRNQALMLLATVTARHVPRIQAECLAHLTFGLQEKDYSAFLMIARNRELPLESRLNFVRNTLEMRRPEFSGWLAQNLVNDPEGELASLARNYLKEPRLQPSESSEAKKGGI